LGVVHRDLKSANILMSKPGKDVAANEDDSDDDETFLY
jgi:serine/threonine protein kinase